MSELDQETRTNVYVQHSGGHKMITARIATLQTTMLCAVLATAAGCAFDASEGDGESPEVEGTYEALTGPTVHFISYGFSGSSSAETFTECPADSILTGFGGRVDANGNFTNIKVWCRQILSNGTLGSEFSIGSGEEVAVHTDAGFVAVGFGGIVSSNNLTRAVVRQCPWNASSRSVSIHDLCNKKSSAGGTETERFIDLHSGIGDHEKQKRVLVGVGMTASNDNLAGVRAEFGNLK